MAKRMVKVRGVLAVWPSGDYHFFGALAFSGDDALRAELAASVDDYESATICFLNAEVPLPASEKPQEIEAKVEKAEDGAGRAGE